MTHFWRLLALLMPVWLIRDLWSLWQVFFHGEPLTWVPVVGLSLFTLWALASIPAFMTGGLRAVFHL